MADDDDDRDEEWFKEVYGKEYTGPHSRSRRDDKQNSKPTAKRAKTSLNGSGGESEEEEGPPDPNAVPTDFTSREAKVWEAKAKAIERNWKRRKEEELNCKICGESGHFAQGCPTTLGGNRKSGDVVERIPLRDKRLKPRIIGSGGSTIQGIEKDTGCRLKLEDNVTPGNSGFYVRISGPDRLAVSKAAGAVRRLVDQVEDEWKQPSGGRRQQAPTRGSNVNPLIAAQMQHIQRLQHGATLQGTPGRSDHSGGDEDKRSLDQSQHDVPRHWDSGSTQGRGGSGQYYHGQTPDAYQGRGRGSSVHNGDQDADFKHDDLPQTLEALERRFVQETMHLTTEQEAEEDKENARHRERMREIQEQYQQKMINLRTKQSKYREDFLRREGQVRQQQYHQHYAPSHYDQYGPSGGNDVQGQLSGYDYGDSLPHYGNAPHSYHGKHGHSQYSYGSRNSPSYQTYG